MTKQKAISFRIKLGLILPFGFYFFLYVSCCRKAAKILRLILCAPLKVLRLRMTEWCVNIDCRSVVCAVTIPPSRLRRATSLYTKEAPVSANISLNCHSEQKRCVWENRKRVRRICDGVAFPIFLWWYVFNFPIGVCCCRFTAKILRLILCAPLKVLRLRMTEYGVTQVVAVWFVLFTDRRGRRSLQTKKGRTLYSFFLQI